jgi:hypothetical protein
MQPPSEVPVYNYDSNPPYFQPTHQAPVEPERYDYGNPYETNPASSHRGHQPLDTDTSRDRNPYDNYSHGAGPNNRGYNYNNENDVPNYRWDQE